jgi:hypothetical protein
MKERKISPVSRLIQDCKNEQLELNMLLKMFRGVHPVLVIPDVHGRELAEKLRGGGAMPPHQHWLYTEEEPPQSMFYALRGVLCLMRYNFSLAGRFQLSEEQAGAIAACTSCKAAKTGGWLSVFSAWRQKA